MTDDPWNHPKMRRWAAAVEADLVPKIRSSGMSATLWAGEVDVKLAVELGVSLLMDKPLLLLVEPGVKVPERLARAADRIVEADVTTDEGRARMAQRIREVADELLGGDDAE